MHDETVMNGQYRGVHFSKMKHNAFGNTAIFKLKSDPNTKEKQMLDGFMGVNHRLLAVLPNNKIAILTQIPFIHSV
jgi:hypothetical protein